MTGKGWEGAIVKADGQEHKFSVPITAYSQRSFSDYQRRAEYSYVGR
jgi:hypothetical protein